MLNWQIRYVHRHAFNGRDLRPQPPAKRQERLRALLGRFGCPAVSLSEPFEDGLALLRVAEEGGLEGIVSKRRDARYRSGQCRRKVKTLVWRESQQGAMSIVWTRLATCHPQLLSYHARACSLGQLHDGAIFQILNIRVALSSDGQDRFCQP